MTKHLGTAIMIITLFSILSCEEQTNYYEGYEQTIIVDGSIELNGFPTVILTRNIPYYVNIDSADLPYLILRQAKITVSDEETSEVLTLKYKKDKFPPYFYEGNEIKGRAGHTYKLLINYGNKTLTASTTIPYPVLLDSVWFQSNSPADSLGKINAIINDNTATNYYRTYTKIKTSQNQYYPTLISNYNDQLFNGKAFTFHFSKGPETFLDISNANFNFNRGDTIYLKICTVDKPNYEFWKSYQNEVSNGANPFASSYHKIESNIEGEGKGIWGGYGSTVYQVIAK